MNNENEIELAQYAEYLLKRHLVAEQQAGFYVRWVRMFLGEPQDSKLSLGERINCFIERLRASARWPRRKLRRATCFTRSS
jgi:hypothetical protein